MKTVGGRSSAKELDRFFGRSMTAALGSIFYGFFEPDSGSPRHVKWAVLIWAAYFWAVLWLLLGRGMATFGPKWLPAGAANGVVHVFLSATYTSGLTHCSHEC